MPNRVGFVVEGPDDEIVVKGILEKLRVPFKIRVARGSGNLKRKAASYSELLRSSGCEKIIVIRDLNCDDYDSVRNDLAECLVNDIKLCIPIHEMESWLLADDAALSTVLHSHVSPVSDPESVHDAKARMKEIFEKFGRSYVPLKDLPQITHHLKLDAVRKKCGSYLTFENLVNDC